MKTINRGSNAYVNFRHELIVDLDEAIDMMKKSERHVLYAKDILLNEMEEHSRYRAAWAFDRAAQYHDLDLSFVIGALKQAFYNDESSGVRFYAASAIRRARMHKKTEKKARVMVEEALSSERLAIRSAMAAVLLINDSYKDSDLEKLLAIIKQGLSDKQIEGQWFMAEGVQKVAERTSLFSPPIPELIKLLVHKNSNTRQSAAEALSAIRKNGTEVPVNKGNIAIFWHALNDDVYEARIAAVDILSSASTKVMVSLLAPLVPRFIFLMHSTHAATSSNAVYALFGLAKRTEKIKRMVIPEFLRVFNLTNESEGLQNLRKRIMDGLLRLGLDVESKMPFLPHLANAIFDEDWEIRRDTIGILEHMIKNCTSISNLDQIKIHVRDSAIAHKDSERFKDKKHTCLTLLAQVNRRKNSLLADQFDIRVDKKILRLARQRQDGGIYRMRIARVA